MLSCIPEKCVFRRVHTVIDVELELPKETSNENGSEISEPSVESREMPRKDGRAKRSYLEIWLNIFYFIGVSPFRVDYQRNLSSFCINKVSVIAQQNLRLNYFCKMVFEFFNTFQLASILIKTLAIMYSILNIRRVVWRLDNADLTQQQRASSCIGLVNQFCSLLLHLSLLRMSWFKQVDFQRLFKFQDCIDLDTRTNPIYWKCSLGTFLTILLCIVTVFISLLSSVGGLPIMSWIDTWTFSEILLYNEDVFVLSLKKFNESTQDNSTHGYFIKNADLETVIIGSTGIGMNFCKLIDTFYSHDCLLLCTISLWMSTKPLRDQLSLWESRRQENTDDELESQNLAEDLLKKHKELTLLSKQINTITNIFLPILSMTSMITMSYFMHTCVIRDWFFALYLALKLGKVCIAIYFAIKISNVAAACNSWFISEDVQSVLKLNAKEFQRQNAAMNQEPFGIGNGVFYIDTRYFLNGSHGSKKSQRAINTSKKMGGHK
ncbi:unnamed protein product [Orchesella dallaii]|uniref:Gustatory receptor n=1 Tax=Orchesella dallaii TaxID=48710 RepID=A0ABP1PRW6_9HEXA